MDGNQIGTGVQPFKGYTSCYKKIRFFFFADDATIISAKSVYAIVDTAIREMIRGFFLTFFLL